MVGGLKSQLRPRHGPPGRHLHWHLVRRRRRLLRAGGAAALLAVVGPGVLAGLSDDDPSGITTYSILGAKFGYQLLWVLGLSTVALIVRAGGPEHATDPRCRARRRADSGAVGSGLHPVVRR